MSNGKVLIYGANGYSGRLAALHAAECGVDATLAGRSADKVRAVAEETSLPWKAFGLNPAPEIDEHIRGFDVVLNCAGPFSRTTAIFLQACLREGVHYTDITGELDVIEYCSRLDEDAKEAGIVIMPATGFDVVPTDTVALHLSEQMPDATHLDLAFAMPGGLSHGTATTMVENLGEPSAERQGGRIVQVPTAAHVQKFDFGRGPKTCMSIPWGDVSSAYHTTGIPNIRTFIASSERSAGFAQKMNKAAPVLKSMLVQTAAKALLNRFVDGPSDEVREKGSGVVYGEVRNALGEKRAARLTCPSGYQLTWMTSLAIARELAAADEVQAGFTTPAGYFGTGFIQQLDGVSLEDV